MIKTMRVHLAAAVLTTATLTAYAADDQRPAKPTFDATGTVHVPAFELPPSELSSPEAREMMQRRAEMGDRPAATREPDIEKSRRALAEKLAPQLDRMLQRHPVDVEESAIADVPVRVVTPKDGKIKSDRVLINLHGGAFNTCWESCSILESAPIAEQGDYKVVSVNYRMAPEAQHPAGVEDVEKVYRELLNDYQAEQIGVYGCSAGGSLTAQTAAWLPARGLPQPGVIGIFGAGAVRFNTGDSAHIAAYIDGSFPPPPGPGEERIDMTRGYFEGADMSSEIISPALHPEVLKKFPPTMIITGTRAMDMSPAIYTNSQLINVGKRPLMIVGEGMGHCYLYTASLPESQNAYKAIVDFFDENLQ